MAKNINQLHDMVNMRILPALLIALLMILPGCMKTRENYFSITDECRKFEELNDPNDYRDDYDECIMNAENELTDAELCKKKCGSYCEDLSMEFLGSGTDFGGCRCKCRVILE